MHISSLLSFISLSPPNPPPPQTSPLFRLPPELRIKIYAHVLTGTEHPLFFIENAHVWRCGPPSAFKRPGPPSLLRVCRSIAEEASQVLHEVRELHLLFKSHGIPTEIISCYHRFCTWEEFMPVLKRIQRLTLLVNAHPRSRQDATMASLDAVCRLLEERPLPPQRLGVLLECCFADGKRGCVDGELDLARRFQELGPVYVDHSPWNGRCSFARVRPKPGFEGVNAGTAVLEYPALLRRVLVVRTLLS